MNNILEFPQEADDRIRQLFRNKDKCKIRQFLLIMGKKEQPFPMYWIPNSSSPKGEEV